jgi:hypothetical protein
LSCFGPFPGFSGAASVSVGGGVVSVVSVSGSGIVVVVGGGGGGSSSSEEQTATGSYVREPGGSFQERECAR